VEGRLPFSRPDTDQRINLLSGIAKSEYAALMEEAENLGS